MRSIKAALVVTAFAGTHGFAHAQAGFYRAVTPPGASQGGLASAALLVGREYQGSDESRVRLLPGLDYQWRNGFFAGTSTGLGFNASSAPSMAYGARITADFGRKERRSNALRGLGDVEPRPEIGAFFSISPTRNVALNSSLRYGSGNDRDGLLLEVGASWSVALNPALRLGTSLAATWGNAKYLRDYFGVSVAQSGSSAYQPFVPDAGLRDLRLGVSLAYRIAPAWTLIGAVTHTGLQGDARRSPIVRETGTNSALLSLGYSF